MERKYFFLLFVHIYLVVCPPITAQSGTSLTFSEVLFYPSEQNGEFVEIYNTSASEPVDISGFKIKYYNSSPNPITAFIGGTILAPGKFAVILQGSYDYQNGIYKSLIPAGVLVLKLGTGNFGSSGMANTTNRELCLLNASDEIVDSYIYSADNSAGYSDEKRTLDKNNSAGNWSNSNVVNGTPGFKSSAVTMPHYFPGTLVINEIMFDPAPGNSEYLEFFNASEDSIQLAGLQIKSGTAGRYRLSDSFMLLPPKKYFVLYGDSAIFNNYYRLKSEGAAKFTAGMSLSNEGSTLVLKDFFGATLDSLTYLPEWHSKSIADPKNRSLEKLNPVFDSGSRSSWNSCADSEGGTPGRQNSLFSQNLFYESKVTINPNPFSPDGDGFEDFAVINFDLTRPVSQVRIKVFDSQGRLVRTLSENRIAASTNSVVFDGLDDSGNPLRIGIYILLIETAETGTGNSELIKAPVVIARKL